MRSSTTPTKTKPVASDSTKCNFFVAGLIIYADTTIKRSPDLLACGPTKPVVARNVTDDTYYCCEERSNGGFLNRKTRSFECDGFEVWSPEDSEIKWTYRDRSWDAVAVVIGIVPLSSVILIEYWVMPWNNFIPKTWYIEGTTSIFSAIAGVMYAALSRPPSGLCGARPSNVGLVFKRTDYTEEFIYGDIEEVEGEVIDLRPDEALQIAVLLNLLAGIPSLLGIASGWSDSNDTYYSTRFVYTWKVGDESRDCFWLFIAAFASSLFYGGLAVFNQIQAVVDESKWYHQSAVVGIPLVIYMLVVVPKNPFCCCPCSAKYEAIAAYGEPLMRFLLLGVYALAVPEQSAVEIFFAVLGAFSELVSFGCSFVPEHRP